MKFGLSPLFALVLLGAGAVAASAAGRPELHAFPFKTPVTAAGEYAADGIGATLSGGAAEDFYTTEDEDGNAVYYYVTLTSSTKTSGGSSTCNTTQLIASGIYPVMAPSSCYAIKGGAVEISGGTVRVRATGTAGRGIGGDSLAVTGGAFDIEVAGGPTDVYVEMLDETALATCLDSGSAACLKTSGADSVMTLAGGTFRLAATGPAGKLVNAAGSLVVGTEGAATLPTDASFSPDISGATTGAKVFCTALKQKEYGSLATAVADLLADAPWSADLLVCASTNEVSGVETYVLPETADGEASPVCAFARLSFAAAW